MAAILLGASAVTLAVGLSSSLNLVVQGLSHDGAEPVQVQLPGNGPGGLVVKHLPNGKVAKSPASTSGSGPGSAGGSQPSSAVAQRTVEAALRAEPGTLHYVAEAEQLISIAALSQPVQVTAFRGDARWTGYDMISGHWYAGPRAGRRRDPFSHRNRHERRPHNHTQLRRKADPGKDSRADLLDQ